MKIGYAIGNIQYDIPVSRYVITIPIANYSREDLISEIFREFDLMFDPLDFSMEEWGEIERDIQKKAPEILLYLDTAISNSPEILENEDVVLYIVVR